jgi:hypothetical protein
MKLFLMRASNNKTIEDVRNSSQWFHMNPALPSSGGVWGAQLQQGTGVLAGRDVIFGALVTFWLRQGTQPRPRVLDRKDRAPGEKNIVQVHISLPALGV